MVQKSVKGNAFFKTEYSISPKSLHSKNKLNPLIFKDFLRFTLEFQRTYIPTYRYSVTFFFTLL